jgi:hypothetical protein
MSNYHLQHRGTITHNPTDAELLLRLSIALAAKQRTAWRVVRVGARDGIVRLEGVVPTFYDRQLILAVARHVAGVLRVEDELAIADVSPTLHEAAVDGQVAPPAVDHGGSGTRPVQLNGFHHLPVLAPSLEDILRARGEGVSVVE